MEIKNNNMTIKKLITKARKLRNDAAFLEQQFHYAAIKYLNTIVSVASCNSDDTDGKACFEEIDASYNSDNDLVTIEYVIMNKYGDFVETRTIQVSAREIEKFLIK